MLAIEALVPTGVVGRPSKESREYTLDADEQTTSQYLHEQVLRV